MALSDTNVSLAAVVNELGYTATAGQPIKLSEVNRKAHNNGVAQSTETPDLSTVQTNHSLGNFKSYDHYDLHFKFDPYHGYDVGDQAGESGNSSYFPPTSNDNVERRLARSGASFTTNSQGNQVLSFSGGVYTSTPSTIGDYAYFESDATSGAGGKGFKFPTSSSVATIVFWVRPEISVSGNTNIIMTDLDDDPSNYPHNNNYSGFDIVQDSNGRIRWVRGDGGGTSASNRATFNSGNTLDIGGWNMVAIVMSGANTTGTGTTTNYCYIHREDTNSTSGGANFMSGSGGAVAYESQATLDMDTMYLSAGNQGARYFQGQLGHIWVFDRALSSSEVGTLVTNTSSYYY